MIPIIVVNWNGINDTLECIESVLNQDYQDYHIYLIDNASDNEEGALLKSKYFDNSKVSVFLYKQNLGFTGAHLKIWNDYFIQDKSIKHIALLNNDTIIDGCWLDSLMHFAKAKKADIVSSKMIQYWDRSKMDNAGHKMLNTGEILPIGHGEPIEKYENSFENMGGCGGAVLYSTAMLRQIGFFDDYFSTGYEDAELGLRAICSGYTSWYCPDAIVFHKGGQSIKKVFDQKYAIQTQINIFYTALKLFPPVSLCLAVFQNLLRNIVLGFGSLIMKKWSLYKVILKSQKLFLQKDLQQALIQRKIYAPHRTLTSFWLFLKSHSTFKFELIRVISIIISNRKTAFEKF